MWRLYFLTSQTMSIQHKLRTPGFHYNWMKKTTNFTMQRCHDLEFVVNCGKGSFDLHRLYGVKNVGINKKNSNLSFPQKFNKPWVEEDGLTFAVHLEETARGSNWWDSMRNWCMLLNELIVMHNPYHSCLVYFTYIFPIKRKHLRR